jgi:hypothetical protein
VLMDVLDGITKRNSNSGWLLKVEHSALFAGDFTAELRQSLESRYSEARVVGTWRNLEDQLGSYLAMETRWRGIKATSLGRLMASGWAGACWGAFLPKLRTFLEQTGGVFLDYDRMSSNSDRMATVLSNYLHPLARRRTTVAPYPPNSSRQGDRQRLGPRRSERVIASGLSAMPAFCTPILTLTEPRRTWRPSWRLALAASAPRRLESQLLRMGSSQLATGVRVTVG